MPTNRTPRRPPGKFRITPHAADLFRRLQEVDACNRIENNTNTKCEACLSELQLDQELRAELGMTKSFQYPTVVPPEQPCPYPPHSGAALWWPEAQELWRRLEEAAGE